MSESAENANVTLSKPSIFEIVSHQAVAEVFKPAFRYVVKILVQKYPESFSTIFNYVDELCLICGLVLQKHYLGRYNASLSENIYFLKRVDVSGGDCDKLSEKLEYLCLLEIVLWPYVKTKVDAVFERLRESSIRDMDNSEQSSIKKMFLEIYPYIHFTVIGIFSIYQFGYTLKLFNYHSPIFHALKIQLVRANSNDLLGVYATRILSSRSLWQTVSTLPGLLLEKTLKFSTKVMPAVVFFLQFIEWWYSQNHEMTSSVTNLPIPCPPQMPKVSSQGCGLPPHPLQCPLCHKIRTNMAALVSSGFVFCYPCIYQYISENGCCPVTDVPSCLDQIIRIYSVPH